MRKKFLTFFLLFFIILINQGCTFELSELGNNVEDKNIALIDDTLIDQIIELLDSAYELARILTSDVLGIWNESITRQHCCFYTGASLSIWARPTSLTESEISASREVNPYVRTDGVFGSTRNQNEFILLVMYTHQFLGNYDKLQNSLDEVVTKFRQISNNNTTIYNHLQDYYVKINLLNNMANDLSGYSYSNYNTELSSIFNDITQLRSLINIHR